MSDEGQPMSGRVVRLSRDGEFTINDRHYVLTSGSAVGSGLYRGQWYVQEVPATDPHAVLWVENTYREARDRIDRMASGRGSR